MSDATKGVIIVINPGSTSTKIALFRDGRRIAGEAVHHPTSDLAIHDNVTDQFELRMEAVSSWLTSQNTDDNEMVGVAGRGAPLCPVEGGVYRINQQLLADLRNRRYSNHASNLGAIMADSLGRRYGVPAYIVDPITVTELSPVARVSGFPEIDRRCRLHVLNIKEVCRRASERLGKHVEDCQFVAVHMGGGVSVGSVDGGRIVDCNDALLGMGPFSPNRAGGLPIEPLVKLCFGGKYTEEQLLDRFLRHSGLEGYIGETDLRVIEQRIDEGDTEARHYYEAMIYQIAKEIGAYATVFKGCFDAILLTGGMANSQRLVITLKDYIAYLGRVLVIPGEHEMEALAHGVLRVLRGEETPHDYDPDQPLTAPQVQHQTGASA